MFSTLPLLTLAIATFLPPSLSTPTSSFPSSSYALNPRSDFSPSFGYRSNPLKRFTEGYFCKTLSINIDLPTWTCVITQDPDTGEESKDCSTPGDDQDIVLSASYCICVSAGIFTFDTTSRFTELITANGTEVLGLTSYTNDHIGYTGDSLLAYITNKYTNLMSSDGDDDTCDYPTGCQPTTCGGCDYTCPNDGYVCGNTCVDKDTVCSSGIPQTDHQKRRFSNQNTLECLSGYTACGVSSYHKFGGYECIDTTTNIESCGGCIIPLSGAAEGVDCTSINHSSEVECVGGGCKVLSCQKGYMVSEEDDRCEKIEGRESRGAMKYKRAIRRESF